MGDRARPMQAWRWRAGTTAPPRGCGHGARRHRAPARPHGVTVEAAWAGGEWTVVSAPEPRTPQASPSRRRDRAPRARHIGRARPKKARPRSRAGLARPRTAPIGEENGNEKLAARPSAGHGLQSEQDPGLPVLLHRLQDALPTSAAPGMEAMWWNIVNTLPGQGTPRNAFSHGGGSKDGEPVAGAFPSLREFGEAWDFHHSATFNGDERIPLHPQRRRQRPRLGPELGRGHGRRRIPQLVPSSTCSRCAPTVRSRPALRRARARASTGTKRTASS